MNGQILRSLKETISFEHPTYIGGGTDIMPLLKNGVRDDCELVFLKKIPELREAYSCVQSASSQAQLSITSSAAARFSFISFASARISPAFS